MPSEPEIQQMAKTLPMLWGQHRFGCSDKIVIQAGHQGLRISGQRRIRGQIILRNFSSTLQYCPPSGASPEGADAFDPQNPILGHTGVASGRAANRRCVKAKNAIPAAKNQFYLENIDSILLIFCD